MNNALYKTRTICLILLIAAGCMGVFAADSRADEGTSVFPMNVNVSLEKGDKPVEIAKTMQIFFLITVISIAPALMIMLTSFTRIIIVLSLLQRSINAGGQPSKQIIAGLALFLTFFIMAPVWKQVNAISVQPYVKGELTQIEAYKTGIVPIREFLFKQTREKDLELFVSMSKIKKPKKKEDIPTYVLIPSFIISELKTAFQMGFLLFLPFLIIDMTVASVLLSMGMMMLPPIIVSMPFKILLFVLVDGWYLVVKSLSMSF